MASLSAAGKKSGSLSAIFRSRNRLQTSFFLLNLGRLVILLLPAVVLAVGAFRTWLNGNPSLKLELGIVFQLLVLGFQISYHRNHLQTVMGSLFVIYLTGIACLWLANSQKDLYLQSSQAFLLLVFSLIFGWQIVVQSGGPKARRACLLSQRLVEYKGWPADVESYSKLPQLQTLRDALGTDATPVLILLENPSLPVQVAALTILESWKSWRKGQPELILEVVRRSQDPGLRSAGLRALAAVEDRNFVEQVATFLRDKSPAVRLAAMDAVVGEGGRHWPWIRQTIREVLGDQSFRGDGPLHYNGGPLNEESVKDLTAWAGEKGILGIRSALTLGVHFGRVLREHSGEDLITELRRLLADAHSPPGLRMELAKLLEANHLIDREVQERLLDPINPAPLRLIAAEGLLKGGGHQEAVGVLRELARLPNREMGLATASVIQRCLGIDMGLVPGQPIPLVQSRQAAEVTRRAMAWAVEAWKET